MSRITLISPEVSMFDISKDCDLPHVLLVLDQIPRYLGGGERIALKLSELLPQYGYRASIITFSTTPDNFAVRSSSCPIYSLPLIRTYDLSAVFAFFDFSYFLYRQNVNIVQTFFESSDLWAGLVTKITSSAKLIWSRRDMAILRSRKHRIAYRIMADIPDAVFAVSDRVRRFCIDVDRIEPDRVQTIYNGITFSNNSLPLRSISAASGMHVISLGNIRRVKGFDVFIRAAALIVPLFPNVSFSIAGDVLEPDYFAELQSLIFSLNLGVVFSFIGGVSDIQRYLYGANIFVSSSRSEGFSNAIIEAMAAALPVVATNVGGNAEAVIDGVNGYLVPSDDPETLSTAILALLSNPKQAMAMGLAGQKYASEHFSIDAMMTRIVGIYDKLLAI